MASYASQEQRAAETWHEIDLLIEEIAKSATSGLPQPEFYERLLTRLARMLPDSVLVAAWVPTADRWRLLGSVTRHPEVAQPPSSPPDAWIARSLDSSEPVIVAADPKSDGPISALAAVAPGAEPYALIEVRWSTTRGRRPNENELEVLAAICEIAGDYHLKLSRTDDQLGARDWQRINQFAQAVHRYLDLDATCYAVANESRRLIDCDRVSVLVERQRRFRLQAVSGLDHFDSRSGEVKSLERLVTTVARTGEALWSDGVAVDLPEQIERCLTDYADHAGARTIIVLPLGAGGESSESEESVTRHDCPSAIVVERFDAQPFDKRQRQYVEASAQHSSSALHHAMRYSGTPWLARALSSPRGGPLSRRFLAVAVLLGSIAAAVAGALMVQTDFEVSCRGVLQPIARRDIFAPLDGTVERLLVTSGDRVDKDHLLLVLESTELQYEQTRLNGELQTSRGNLHSVRASLATTAGQGTDSRARRLQLAAEEQSLKELITSLERRSSLLQQQSDQLRVTSPVAGQVLTSSVEQRLDSRPVKRGQRLLTVANTDGPWQLELKVAERDAGHVIAARATMEKVPISYVLTAAPSQRRLAELVSIGVAAEIDEMTGAVLPVTASIDSGEQGESRPGAGVVARVHCGRRPLGYVWLRDIVDFIRLRFL